VFAEQGVKALDRGLTCQGTIIALSTAITCREWLAHRGATR
jgi:hypothetical protein